MDLQKIIDQFKKDKMIFHSEDDLKFKLAWAIHKQNKKAEIILEKPISKAREGIKNKRIHVDIIVNQSNICTAIELKYKTRELVYEEYELTGQGAQNNGKEYFENDIDRLENMIRKKKAINGYALFITNDHLYWKEGRKNSLRHKEWKDYISIKKANNGIFKYLLVEVK